jgi:hypothetical protein
MLRRTLFLCPLLTTAVASAQPVGFEEALEAREVAMGGAYRALGTTAVGVDGNPAAIGLAKTFQVDVGGAYDFGNKTWYVAGYVRDSQTSALAAGYSIHYLSQQVTSSTGVTDNITGFQQVFAFALPVADIASIGVSTHWLVESALNINAASLDVGAAFKIAKLATIGFAGHNLIDTNHPLQLGRYFDLSGGLTLGPVQLAIDIRSNFGPNQFHPKYSFGTEIFLGSTFIFRAGLEWYTLTQSTFLTAGIGFVVDKGGFDFGYRQSLNGVGNLLVATLRVTP